MEPLREREEGLLPGMDVAEIHAYPLRPEGFEEPLFPTTESNREIAEHLLEAPWLSRASELEGKAGGAAHVLEEPIELRKSPGRTEIVRIAGGRRCHLSWKRRRVEKVLDRWRRVGEWWDADHSVDRVVFRVLLSGGFVVDLAREFSSCDWLLVGVVD
jgi:hypothetical protein